MVSAKIVRQFALAAGAAMALLVSVPASAKDVQLFSPDQVAGFAGNSSSMPGARHFKIMGHDGKEVVATKVWLPANSDFPPHGKVEQGKATSVFVLSGDLQLGMGDKFDEGQLKSTPVGSVIVLTPDNATHFARTGAKPVELLLIQSFAGDFARELKLQ